MKVYIFLFDGFSDWEMSFFTPTMNTSEKFELVYFSIDGKPVISMGGMRVMPHISLDEVVANDVEFLVLPGGTTWVSGANTEIIPLVMAVNNKKATIAAICAATIFIARLGLLDNVKHTSNVLFFLKNAAPQYRGSDLYVDDMAVVDDNIITAKGTAPIEFARAIFRKFDVMPEVEVEKWFQLYKNSIWSK